MYVSHLLSTVNFKTVWVLWRPFLLSLKYYGTVSRPLYISVPFDLTFKWGREGESLVDVTILT